MGRAPADSPPHPCLQLRRRRAALFSVALMQVGLPIAAHRDLNEPVAIDERVLAADACRSIALEKPALLGEDQAEARSVCGACVNKTGCHWCPLTQTCQKKRTTCVVRKGEHSDNPVIWKSVCEASATSWNAFMHDAYGADWETTYDSHLDVIRCSQWVLGWQISADPTMRKDGITNDDVGDWACTSAVIRSSVYRLLSKTHASVYEPLSRKWTSGGWPTTTVTPKICGFIRLHRNYAWKTCEVDLNGIDEFALLRTSAMAPNAKGPADVGPELLQSIQSGPVVSFSPGAGKSGSGFCRTWDNNFKIKRGVKQSMLMNEPNNLMTLIFGQGLTPMHLHFQNNPSSMLNRYYGLFKIKLDDNVNLIMQDATYYQDDRVQTLRKKDPGLKYTRYDLKGASRDLDKRQDPDKQFCLINGDFKVNEGNRLSLSNSQCYKLREAMRADVAFLNAHSMIDYSIFMGIAEQQNGRAPDCKGTPGEPFCFREGKRQYTISIIDYLNDKNTFKSMESLLNWGKFADYDKKVVAFTEEICPCDEKFEKQKPIIVTMCLIAGAFIILVSIVSIVCLRRRMAEKPPTEKVTGAAVEFTNIAHGTTSTGLCSKGHQPAWGMVPSGTPPPGAPSSGAPPSGSPHCRAGSPCAGVPFAGEPDSTGTSYWTSHQGGGGCSPTHNLLVQPQGSPTHHPPAQHWASSQAMWH